jgi:phage N-6-adenine-methyltransferase
MPAQRPGSSRQDVRTPREFLAAARAKLGIDAFTVDLAATRENTVAQKFYSPRVNSLVQPWNFSPGFGWCNPPFSDLAPWARKGYEESLKGARTTMLVPASVGSNWWRDWTHDKAHVLFLNGRITFVGHEDPYPKDLALLIYARGWRAGYAEWSWMEPGEERPAAVKHVESLDVDPKALPPFEHQIGLRIGEQEARMLMDGVVPESVAEQARCAVDWEFELAKLGTRDQRKRKSA